MNQISPFKSSAFRITLVYLVLFGISVSIILGFIYWSTIVYKTQQTDDDINAEIAAISDIEGGMEALMNLTVTKIVLMAAAVLSVTRLTQDLTSLKVKMSNRLF